MGNKVILMHEDNLFKVYINDKVAASGTDIDEMVEKFKQIFKDNTPSGSYVSWEDIYNRVARFNNSNIEINTEYKTIEYKKMKYFFGTNKIFYIDDTMTPLLGGYGLFDFIMGLLHEGLVDDYENILIFCKSMMENEILYRIFDTNIVVSSPGFNYGSIGYNFSTKKISKGTAIIQGNFEDFFSYVKENL
ncbi:MAG: hypothetical protein ACI398_09850 [Clostridium sp.]